MRDRFCVCFRRAIGDCDRGNGQVKGQPS
jgi:hypothetical protein